MERPGPGWVVRTQGSGRNPDTLSPPSARPSSQGPGSRTVPRGAPGARSRLKFRQSPTGYALRKLEGGFCFNIRIPGCGTQMSLTFTHTHTPCPPHMHACAHTHTRTHTQLFANTRGCCQGLSRVASPAGTETLLSQGSGKEGGPAGTSLWPGGPAEPTGPLGSEVCGSRRYRSRWPRLWPSVSGPSEMGAHDRPLILNVAEDVGLVHPPPARTARLGAPGRGPGLGHRPDSEGSPASARPPTAPTPRPAQRTRGRGLCSRPGPAQDSNERNQPRRRRTGGEDGHGVPPAGCTASTSLFPKQAPPSVPELKAFIRVPESGTKNQRFLPELKVENAITVYDRQASRTAEIAESTRADGSGSNPAPEAGWPWASPSHPPSLGSPDAPAGHAPSMPCAGHKQAPGQGSPVSSTGWRDCQSSRRDLRRSFSGPTL